MDQVVVELIKILLIKQKSGIPEGSGFKGDALGRTRSPNIPYSIAWNTLEATSLFERRSLGSDTRKSRKQ